MAAKDEEVPKLGSLPPEGESDEVTRVGSRDEIARALLNEVKDLQGAAPRAGNNLPTPPAPPPSAEIKQVLVAEEPKVGMRLAPPPADLAGERPNDMPTKPPVAGVVSDLDVDAAFTDELDPSLLEAAPPSARSAAPPLPPAARRSTTPQNARPSVLPTTPPVKSNDIPTPAVPTPAPVITPSMAPAVAPSIAPSLAPSHLPAPLVPRESQSPTTRPRTALALLLVVGAVVAAFFVAAMLSGR